MRPRAKILKKAVQVVELDDSKFFFFILAWVCNNIHLAGLEAILFFHLMPAGALHPENPCGMFNVVLFLSLFAFLILHFLIPLPSLSLSSINFVSVIALSSWKAMKRKALLTKQICVVFKFQEILHV